jgi:uroporphyrinogen-III synthase
VTAYRTATGTGGADLPKILRDEGVDAFTFCSPSAVTGFIERFGADHIALSIAQSLPTACIGPATRDTARANGFTRAECPERHTITDLVSLLEELRFVETAGGSRWL